jgi:phosphoglycerate dehydrogenase-like enzyme
VNTARGGLVDESALVDALDSGQLSGAALEVFVQEPPALGNRLLTLPNVIVAPHTAGETLTSVRDGLDIAISQVRDALARRKPPHLVNPEAWPHARLHRSHIT